MSDLEYNIILKTIYRASIKGTPDSTFGYFDNASIALDAVKGRGEWAGDGLVDEVTGFYFVGCKEKVFLIDLNKPIKVFSDLDQYKKEKLLDKVRQHLTTEEMNFLGFTSKSGEI